MLYVYFLDLWQSVNVIQVFASDVIEAERMLDKDDLPVALCQSDRSVASEEDWFELAWEYRVFLSNPSPVGP